jgi:hypothetical protein
VGGSERSSTLESSAVELVDESSAVELVDESSAVTLILIPAIAVVSDGWGIAGHLLMF